MLYQFVLNWTWGTKEPRNVLVYEVPVVLDNTQLQTMVDELKVALAPAAPNLSTTCTMVNVDTRRVDLAGFPTLTFAFSTGPYAGGDPSDSVAANTAALIRKSSATPKPNRGRMYLPGLVEPDTAGNVLAAGVIANLQAAATNLLALEYEAGQTGELVIPRWAVDGTSVAFHNVAASFTVQTTLATQRRRLRK